MTMIVAPVTKTLVLECTPERAFAVFTEEIDTWWPIETHSVHGAGGRAHLDERSMYEVSASGDRNEWGTVLVWDPPSRIVMTWAPGEDKSVLTELEVRFTPHGDRTRFELIHRGWERWGETAEANRSGYDGGWDGVLAKYVAATS
jgi:uncharacterized protein YndB with AHSA1/START domain